MSKRRRKGTLVFHPFLGFGVFYTKGRRRVFAKVFNLQYALGLGSRYVEFDLLMYDAARVLGVNSLKDAEPVKL
jgi:hypothetical protein